MAHELGSDFAKNAARVIVDDSEGFKHGARAGSSAWRGDAIRPKDISLGK